MDDRDYFIKFIKKGKFTIANIEKLKKTLSLNDTQLIRKTFKLLNDEIDYLTNNTYFIDNINNSCNLLFIICSYTYFDKESLIVNRKRIKKAREKILFFANNFKLNQLLEAANRLDEIPLGKSLEYDDLNKLLKKLIDKKEDINIIKKVLNTNKGVLLIEKNELFDYIFNYTVLALEENSNDLYYYTALLKIFYSSNIDRWKHLGTLRNVILTDPRQREFENEIYYIIHGQKRLYDKEEILKKYGIITDLVSFNILLNHYQTTEDIIITMDTEGATLKDDAVSINKENNNYIVGIHITDVGRIVRPGSKVDNQAKNNYSCAYMADGYTRLFSSDIEKELSLEKDELRDVISLYITIDEEGKILKYNLEKNTIKVTENYTYSQTDKMLNRVDDDISYKLNQLYDLAGILQYKNSKKYAYWTKKETDSIDKEIIPQRSNKIINELMVLYNSIIATVACENGIPYVYRTQNNAYLENLIKKLEIPLDDETENIIKNIYLQSKYSTLPIYHSGLGLPIYSHSTSAGRRYPDLYNQYLLHNFYFKDINMNFDDDEHENLVNYFNQRNTEIDLMKGEYIRALK